jgi:hypothetical protein
MIEITIEKNDQHSEEMGDFFTFMSKDFPIPPGLAAEASASSPMGEDSRVRRR